MKTNKIKYKTSTDYDELYKILKSGIVVVGFVPVEICSVKNREHSKVIEMDYNEEYGIFNLGFTFFERDFDKISFSDLCKREEIRFIPYK